LTLNFQKVTFAANLRPESWKLKKHLLANQRSFEN